MPFPAHLPGIDIPEARERFLGNGGLLVRMLRQLVDEYGDAAGRFRAQLADGRLEDARTLAHTIKGVAGNCSARILYGIAADLEMRLHEGETPTDADMDRFEAALADVTAGVEGLAAASFEPPPAPEPAPAPAPEEVRRRFQKLDRLLKRHDIRSERAFHDLAAGLCDPAYAEGVETLDRQIRKYQFKAAKKTLAALAEQAGATIEPPDGSA